jgi:hypothetical protein
MRTTNVIGGLVLAAALVLPASLHAQRAAASGTPFRAGQWGAEFSVTDDFQSLGMMRFFNPRRALAFDVQLENESSSVEGSQAETGSTAYGLSAAYRMYKNVSSGVVGYVSGGLLVNSISNENTTGGGVTTETNTKGYGPFAEIGASYFVTPHLSLGATYGLHYLMTSSKTESGGTTTNESSGHMLGSAPISVRISLYF